MKLVKIVCVLLLALPIMGSSGCSCEGPNCKLDWTQVNPAIGDTPVDPDTGNEGEYFTALDGRQYRNDNPFVQKGSPADTLMEATTP